MTYIIERQCLEVYCVATGAICSTYEVTEVLIAVGMTAGVVFALTLFAMQTKIDFTAWGGEIIALWCFKACHNVT